MKFLSLGAGVQSTTLALMASEGVIEMPDCAIFSDTGWEPEGVYRHLNWLETVLRFPLHRVSNGNIREGIETAAGLREGRFAAVPYYLRNPDGSRGMARRNCTRDYKITPITRKQRELLGFKKYARIPAGSAEVWIGISTDEASRMKPATEAWQTNRWPLIELGMSRRDCLRWMEQRGYPRPPKSACLGCPFRSNVEWLEMKTERPDEFADAVQVDDMLRERGLRGLRGTAFTHDSRRPLSEIDFAAEVAKRQGRTQPDLFNMECEGMCGI